ncbi:3-hydroxyanthranilate 3,4-dioxygenase 2 [Cytospora mali]|uniref:3-hydroxyanthranilate 3,4-dioxygenase n=1 Tax=Cytospora mali TaxID=578113 RepID=A0A194W1A5_CYTMA|nr:3-hydroxyanthranilate 3,4-dioxygenase 2 [Valsa mali]
MNGDASTHKPLPPPLAFASWLGQNENLLQPPVNNYCLFSGADFILMVVGGPNTRNDYHVNETEEWFYQLKGAMCLKVVEKDADGNEYFKDVEIKEGEMFLLPGHTPHNPVRFADTIGLVMERTRPEASLDRLRWYCKKGGHERPTVIREEVFHCTDLGTQLKPLINKWREDETLRKCPVCGQAEDPQ